MLTFSHLEKITLLLLLVGSLLIAYKAIKRLRASILMSQGNLRTANFWSRLIKELFIKVFLLRSTWRTRFWSNLFHAFIVWGFLFYLLVNFYDFSKHFFPLLSLSGKVGNGFRLIADLMSVIILIGILYFVLRRFVFKDKALSSRANTLMLPAARSGILRDSAIVAALISLHVASRFLAESFKLSVIGADPWQPLASWLSLFWQNDLASQTAWHVCSWLSLGSLLIFIPYFPYSKHIHLFFAPLNYILKPERTSLGAMDAINFDDETVELFGATHLFELDQSAILDAYACIMCYRCQDVCPPYQTGKLLSPATYEINKRYMLNRMMSHKNEPPPLVEFAIPTQAIWACTACAACVDICPVGVEPMRDILQIRRGLVLMENQFPKPYQLLFRNLERQANPWGLPQTDRLKWAQGLVVPSIQEKPDAELLWWVGCAGAFDSRAQQTSRAFAQLLNQAGVSFAVLGEMENCTGDSARRSGKEDVYFALAQANVEILNEINPKQIVTTCPHCYLTLKNEYPAFGGHYDVIHHSEILNNFPIQADKTNLQIDSKHYRYHDPCYLARCQHISQAPRQVLQNANINFSVPNQSGLNTFCCSAGGAQMWKEEEPGAQSVSAARLAQLLQVPTAGLITACPFCKTMLSDAVTHAGLSVPVSDLAEHLLAQQP